MKKKTRNIIGFFVLILILASVVAVFSSNKFFVFIPEGEKVTKIAIPHFASFKCEPLQDKKGITIVVPEGGATLSKRTAGFYTNGISNIRTEIVQNVWNAWLGFPIRLKYAICDDNGQNCGAYKTYTYGGWGIFSYGLKEGSARSLDFTQESLKVYFERGYGVFGIYYWDEISGGKVIYDGKAFGLTLSSTTQDPAGAVICSTSCELDCPDMGYRQDLLLTEEDILGFYDTSPYLEYWESIDYDLNSQGGATVYNPSTNKFCLAGKVYTGAVLETEGANYIYPNQNTKEVLQCCPGAVISSTYSDKICQSEGTWKTVQDTDKVTCISSINCPNAGNQICQYKELISGYSCSDKDNNNVGICKKDSSTSVECCLQTDCNKDQVCDTLTHTCKGGTPYPVCGDNNVDAGEQCDDGNTFSGDGCSSICESELECMLNSDCNDGKICKESRCIDKEDKCSSCWGWLRNKVSPGYCSQSLLDKFTKGISCPIHFLKIGLLSILSLLIFFLGEGFFKKIGSIGSITALSWIISLIVTAVITFLLYLLLSGVFFWVALPIVLIIFVIIKFLPIGR